MDNWNELPNGRKIKDLKRFSIIVPAEETNRVPLECPVCHYLMATLEDTISFQHYACCSACETRWAYPNKDRWQSGWRPPKELIKKEICEINKLPSFTYQVK